MMKGAVVGRVFGVGDDIGDLRVHRAAQIGGEMAALPILRAVADGTLVVDDAVGVVAAHPTGHRIVIGAVAALVAQRPDDDAGVIFVALDHAHTALHESVQPLGFVGQHVIDRVGLQVGLIPDIQTILVANIVEARVVGIVRGAHGVEIVALHHQDVGQHIFVRHILAVLVVVVVAVGTLDVNHLAVDQQFAVFDLDFAEADPVRIILNRVSVRIFESHTTKV